MEIEKNVRNEKLIKMLKGDIIGEIGTVQENGDSFSIRYNHDTNLFNATLFTKDENEVEIKKIKENLDLKTVLQILNISEIQEGLDKIYTDRIEKEENYKQAKDKLMSQLDKLDLAVDTKKKMEAIIEKVSQLPEKVGMDNRVHLNSHEHLRLADNSNWNDKGELHLQLVQSSGDGYHNYPDMSLKEISNYVKNKDIHLQHEKEPEL